MDSRGPGLTESGSGAQAYDNEGFSWCVCRVFFSKVTGPSLFRGLMGVRQKGGFPDPFVVPHPESLAAQAAYTEDLLTRSGSGPKCFQALGSSPGMLQ